MKPEQISPNLTLLENVDDTEWEKKSLCAQVGTELFFSDDKNEVKAAKRICEQCTVVDQCLRRALVKDERHGVWGGTTPADRRNILKAGIYNPADATEQAIKNDARTYRMYRGMGSEITAKHLGVSTRTVMRAVRRHQRRMHESQLRIENESYAASA